MSHTNALAAQHQRKAAHHHATEATKHWETALRAGAFNHKDSKRAATLLQQLRLYTERLSPTSNPLRNRP